VRAARNNVTRGLSPTGEQQLVCLGSSCLGGTRDEAQAMAPHEIVQVLDANSGKIHDLCGSEYFFGSLLRLSWFASPYKSKYPVPYETFHASGPAKQRLAAIARIT